MSQANNKKLVSEESQELSDDMEVVGPGQMLAEGRMALSLSQEDVAHKLNFRLALVKDIEMENFDKSLPSTFNRGYLRNFAKLVNVSVEDVLASYEMLDVAEKQGAEMQSFSQQTKKQAENNRLMWISYLIIAGIIGSTLYWFFQDTSSTGQVAPNNITSTVTVTEPQAPITTASDDINKPESVVEDIAPSVQSAPETDEPSEQVEVQNSADIKPIINTAEPSEVITPPLPDTLNKTAVTFFFKGDCWVNIYDATGEHIAWGVKKSDYVMNITGVAPFNVTLGKPELVAIKYNGNDIDMSQFNRGNIAKFTLPLTAN